MNSTAYYEARESRQVYDEYHESVFKHMLKMEKLTKWDPDMMSMQPELQWHMRPYLLDFLLETHLGLQLSKETLYLAVNLVDRYCSKRIVFKKHYQLVGCAALWIASKYQDKKAKVPTLDELKLICCHQYDVHMFKQMEMHILTTLEWVIGYPTVDLYLDIYLKGQDGSQGPMRDIALYLCENAMYHRELLVFMPSTISKCALVLGKHLLFGGPDPPMLESKDEMHCLYLLSEYCVRPTACLERKYMMAEFSCVVYYIYRYKDSNEREKEEIKVRWQQERQCVDYLSPPPTDDEDIMNMTTMSMANGYYERMDEEESSDEEEGVYEFEDYEYSGMSTVIYGANNFMAVY